MTFRMLFTSINTAFLLTSLYGSNGLVGREGTLLFKRPPR